MNRSLRDGFRFVSRATPRRILNAAKILGSYHFSRLTGKPHQWGLPVSLSIEPTTSCNLRCPECPSGLRAFTRPTGMLQPELFRKVLDEVGKDLWYLIFYFQGEPYLNPNFLDLVNYASDKGIYTATSTNGHYLNDKNARKTVESGLDRLIISIDGTTQDVYEQYRKGGKLEKVLEGARNVIRWKKELKSSTPHVIFQFLVVRPNEHQIPDLLKLAKEIGADEVGLKTAQVYEYEDGNPLIPLNEKYSRYYKKADGKYGIKNKLLNHCWKLWHSCVITWDGIVVPCCFDKDAEYRMGKLTDTDFRNVWHSDPYNDFRRTLLKGRNEIEMCRNCTEGTKVWN